MSRTGPLTARIAMALALALAVPVVLGAGAAAASDFNFEWIGKVELEAQGLASSDHKRRREAVTQLGKYDISLTAGYLLAALRDSDWGVRAEAGRILGKHKVAKAAPIIIEWLQEPDPNVKQEAADILAGLASEEAITALIRSLGDPDDRVRQRTVVALGTIGTPRVVVPLIGRLEDDKSDVRRAAISQLETIGDRRAAIPLVRAFNDPNLQVRKAAISAVGHLGDPAVIPALLRLLRDSVEEIRSAAIASLGNLHAVAATDALIEELDRSQDNYSSRVAYALGQIASSPAEPPVLSPQKPGSSASKTAGDPASRAARERAVRALVESLARRELRLPASEALRLAGPIAVPALIDHLDGQIEGELATAIELLRDIGDRRATPVLVAELDRGRISRSLVLDALARCGDERALLPILGLLGAENDDIRLHAMTALRPLISDLRAADVLVSLLGDKNLEIRVLAAEYLGLMHSRPAVPALLRLLASGTPPRLQLAAVDALGEIADARAAGPLVAILDHGPPSLLHAAASALIYIGDVAVVDRLLHLASPAGPKAQTQSQLQPDSRPDARMAAARRQHAVRALGGILRDRPNDKARRILLDLAERDDTLVALSAIDALGAMGGRPPTATGTGTGTRTGTEQASLGPLLGLARSGGDRRRAAIAALGNLGDRRAVPVLLEALDASDDRVAGEAAWALGKLGDPGALAALWRATERRGFAAPINASAALARYAPRSQAGKLDALLYHANRFVRVNAAMGLGRSRVAGSRAAVTRVLASDASWMVRVAACRAASQIGGAADALREAAKHDREEPVRQAAQAALAGAFQPPLRTDWRHFYFVDPDRDEAPVEQEPYFVWAADGLVSAFYTDARGLVTEEQFPPGEVILAPRATASRY